MNYTIRIPVFAGRPAYITYYTLGLDAQRCPSFQLFYAHSHKTVCLSPALRACDFQNGAQICLLDMELAAELAEYAEPIMRKRYGLESVVTVDSCTCPPDWSAKFDFDSHAAKAKQMLEKLKASGAPRSLTSKRLALAEVTPINS